MTIERFLPYSGRRYWIDNTGVVYTDTGVIRVNAVDGQDVVELDWVLGRKQYPVGLIVIVCYSCLFLPEHFWEKIRPFRIDPEKSWQADNVSYRFDEPIEVECFPGFFYVPFFTKYAISKEGVLINAENGVRLTWYKTKPSETSNSTGGYHSARVVRGDGRTAMLFRHRALCFTFKPYPDSVNTLVVNHIDGCPEKDHLDNLEWATPKHNNSHAYKLGLRPNASTAVLVKELGSEKICRFSTIAECARHYPILSQSKISQRLRFANGKVYSDRLLLKYDDGSEWPADPPEISRRSGSMIAARNVFTGEIHTFTGTTEGSEYTGVAASTILRHLRGGSRVPFNGYNFRYDDDKSEWPVYSGYELAIFKKYPSNPPDGVFRTDETDVDTFYESAFEASRDNGITRAYLGSLISSRTQFKGKYRFKWLKLHDQVRSSSNG
jgi:hypothetical protein